jgi:hypothetical protein
MKNRTRTYPPRSIRRLKKRFWQGLLDRSVSKTGLFANTSPSTSNWWITTSSGIPGVVFAYVIRKGDFRVELFIDQKKGPKDANKRFFDTLISHKDGIEQAFGDNLSWERLDHARSCRIAYTKSVGGWKSAELLWPKIQDDMIDAMVRLENALNPYLA